jgi:thiol:disulfide interchange protein DsbC
MKSNRILQYVMMVLATAGTLLATVSAYADEAGEISAIRSFLAVNQPNIEVQDIVPSPIAGLYQVNIQNGRTIFVSSDARFLLPGDLYEATDAGLVNLGDENRRIIRKEKIAAVDESEMIIFPAKGEQKTTLTVFTDVDCPYCRKLHGEMDELNNAGISVRYLAFPRTGLNTKEHRKMISTWCSDDRAAMLTSAERGGDVPEVDCDNPVAEQYNLGREVGVTGTPAMVLEDGTILIGYRAAADLIPGLLGE